MKNSNVKRDSVFEKSEAPKKSVNNHSRNDAE